MKRSPGEVYFVGDAASDVQTGRNAGMISVGVLWGYHSREELAAEKPDFLIHAPADLLPIVASDGDPR
jgi:phosphoglycolate phosphatase-like HAD superfamily hydrolase